MNEGFNFGAFFFNFLWALVKGYWLLGVLIFVVQMIIMVAASFSGLDTVGQIIVDLTFSFLIGLFANDLARWALRRKGYEEVAFIHAPDQDHAFAHYVERYEL